MGVFQITTVACRQASTSLYFFVFANLPGYLLHEEMQKDQIDLLEQIDWPHVECLNEKSSNPLANAIKQGYREDDGLHLESDADEQLLMYIPFQQTVKLHSLILKAVNADEAPRGIRIFINK